MLKIFWDKDNIAFIGDQIDSAEHAHCLPQIFLSFDEPLSVTVEKKVMWGKCIAVNKNVPHVFSCQNNRRLSIIVEPSSSFAKELCQKIDGDYLVCDSGIERIQQLAAALVDTDDKEQYADFIQAFAEWLGITRRAEVLDARLVELLEWLQHCDCYDHTIQSLAQRVCLSPSRLSHLFREQIGVPLKRYILFHQLEKAYLALLHGVSITDAALRAGFDSPSHFAATVKKWMGMSAGTAIKDSEFLKVFSI